MAPTITVKTAAVTTTADAAVDPFAVAGVTIADSNVGATDTLTIALNASGATGKLAGSGLSGGTDGVYTLTGSPTTITQNLDALVFTPSAGAPGSSTTTTFTLSDTSSAGTSASPSTVTVTDNDAAVAPTITVKTAAVTTTADAAVDPFAVAGVTIADSNVGATDTLTIALNASGATGKLAGSGLSGGTDGVYTLTGSPTTITQNLDALVFTPSAGAPGSSTTTTFTLSDTSSRRYQRQSNTVTVTDNDAAVAPTITVTTAGQLPRPRMPRLIRRRSPA